LFILEIKASVLLRARMVRGAAQGVTCILITTRFRLAREVRISQTIFACPVNYTIYIWQSRAMAKSLWRSLGTLILPEIKERLALKVSTRLSPCHGIASLKNIIIHPIC